MNKRLLAVSFFLFVSLSFPDAQEKSMELDIIGDSAAITSGIALAIVSELLDQNIAAGNGTGLPDLIAEINPFDRLAVFPYSRGFDLLSDGFQYTLLFLPGILAIYSPSNQWFTAGILYCESALFTFGMKNLLKALFPRNRPLMYFNDPPADYLADNDFRRSFPSGHTATAFNGATFLTFMLYYHNPHSPLNLPIVLTGYALAVSTGIFRILCGAHFISDVLAGATLGTVIGIMVPLLHLQNKKNGSVGISLSVNSIVFALRY